MYKRQEQQAAAAPNEAAAFVPVKEALGNIIQASNTARGGLNRSLNNSALGLHEGMALAAGATTSNVTPVAKAALLHLAKTRGNSTAAWGLPKIASVIESVADPEAKRALIAELLRMGALPAATEQGAMP